MTPKLKMDPIKLKMDPLKLKMTPKLKMDLSDRGQDLLR